MKLKESDIKYKGFNFDIANIIGRGVRDVRRQIKEDFEGYIDRGVFKKLNDLAILGDKIRFAIEYQRANINIKFETNHK